ncbi:GAF domain-containing protein, partial [Chromatium okenii]|uniref:GAF domain-containing protein n=1 Tax=Chromatium okenii TaxID=61644 RepID=UPI0026EF91D4
MTSYFANPIIPDLNQCEAEPIQVPCSIQPHGVLLALYGSKLRITQVSENCQTLLGIAPSDLLERELDQALGHALADAVHSALVRDHEQPGAPASFNWQATGKPAFQGHVHQSDALTVLEMEPVLENTSGFNDMLIQAVRGFDALQRKPDLYIRLQTAAKLFQQLTGYDRVMIYRFNATDWHGEILAEARRSDLEPYLGLHFPASDIPAQARRMYLISPTRVIVDIDYMASPLLPLVNPITAQPLDLSLSQLRSVSPVHLEYLRNMGVQATLTASLLNDGQLWGLIACHHMTPRQLSGDLREIVAWMARDLADQIMLLEERQQQRTNAQFKQYRNQSIDAMRNGRRLAELLHEPELTALLGAVNANGVAVIQNDTVMTGGITPTPAQILDLMTRLSTQPNTTTERLFATDCLSTHLEDAITLVGSAAGLVLLQLNVTQSVKLIWFRDEQLRHITWGGNPDKAMNIEADGRISPRKSFAAWQQTVAHHSRHWS